MIYNIIVGVIVACAVLLLLFIVIRKIPRLKTLDVNTIPEEKEAQVRDRILIERMRRRASRSKEVMGKIKVPFVGKIKNFFSNLFHKIVELEKKYQHESSKKTHNKEAGFDERVKSLVLEAEEFVKSEQLATAEKKYIEAISLDPSSRKAYRGLANIYFLQKEYDQAIQTMKYLIKLSLKACKPVQKKNDEGQNFETCSNAEDLTEDYIKLSEMFVAKQDYNGASNFLKKALSYTPHDPKTLDLLIEINVLLKDKVSAINYFNKLAKVNPENQKLIEYRKRFEEM